MAFMAILNLELNLRNLETDSPCPETYKFFQHTNKCYKIVKEEKRDMADAEAYCLERGVGNFTHTNPLFHFSNVPSLPLFVQMDTYKLY